MGLLVGTRRALLGGGGFDPRALGNLALWTNPASNAALSDAATIQTWADSSGAGHDATQGTAGNRPAFKVGIQNGQPVVRFATTKRMVTGSVDCSAATGFTVYSVIGNVASASDRVILSFGDNLSLGETDGWRLNRSNANKIQAVLVGDVGANYQTSVASVTSAFSLVVATFDKSLATAEAKLWLDGVAGSQTANSNNTNGWGNRPFYLGLDPGGSYPYGGDMGDQLVFTAVHDATTIALVSSWLKAKWGTP